MRNITERRNILGECPVWSARENTLYWLDLLEPALYAYATEENTVRRWPMPEFLGGLALRERGGLVIGLQSRICGFDPQSGDLETLVDIGHMGDGVRFNDAKCDRAGRFFIGSMKDPSIADSAKAEEEKHGAGSLFMLDAERKLHVLETGYTIPNGFAWNLDDTRLYISDSEDKIIYRYDYALEDGSLASKSVFADLRAEQGVPDGACVDEQGFLWSVRHEAGKIVRFSPSGTVERTLDLPVTKPTSLAFGGKNLETLFVTSATQGLSREELRQQPLAGNLLALDAGVRGHAESMYKG